MNPDEAIFDAAAALPEAERAAYLDVSCAADSELRARIEALLRAHEVRGFMDGATRAGDAEAEQARGDGGHSGERRKVWSPGFSRPGCSEFESWAG